MERNAIDDQYAVAVTVWLAPAPTIPALEALTKISVPTISGHFPTRQSLLEGTFERVHKLVPSANAPENIAMLRHVALNLLKGDTTTKKVGIKTRRKKAGWSNEYLAHLLGVRNSGYDPDPPKKRPGAKRA